MAITKALADENRVRILGLLHGGELCVCQIIEVLRLAPSTVSKHLALLRQAQLVESRKKGRWMYYQLPSAIAPPCAAPLRWVMDSLVTDKQFVEDAKLLKSMLKTTPEILCCEQRKDRSAGPRPKRRGKGHGS